MNFVVPGVAGAQPCPGPHFSLPELSAPAAFDTAVQDLYTSVRNWPLNWPLSELKLAAQQCSIRAEQVLDFIGERSSHRQERQDEQERGGIPTIGRELCNLAGRLQNLESAETEVHREILSREGPSGSSQ